MNEPYELVPEPVVQVPTAATAPAAPELPSIMLPSELVNLPQADYVGGGVFPVGHVTVLAAMAKSHKTNVMLDTLQALLEGRPVFGLFQCPRAIGLVLQGDMSGALYAARLRACGLLNANLPFMLGQQFSDIGLVPDLLNDRVAEHIVKKAQEVGARIIIVDSLVYWCQGDEGKKEVAQAIMLRAREIATAASANFVIIHHLRKDNPSFKRSEPDASDIIGSSAFTRLAAEYGLIWRHEPGLYYMRWTGWSAFNETVAFSVGDGDDGILRVTWKGLVSENSSETYTEAIRRKVRELGDTGDGVFSRQDIVNSLQSEGVDVSASLARKVVDTLISERRVRESGTRGCSCVYRVNRTGCKV